MAKITAPVEGFNGTVVGVTFVDGVGETDNEGALAYFERQGYTVEAEAKKGSSLPEGEPSEKWSHEQIDAYAAGKSIDLGAAKKKDEKLAVIAAATSQQSEDEESDDESEEDESDEESDESEGDTE